MKTKLAVAVVFLMAYLARIHRVEKGNFITWDEAHFGRFAYKYLTRLFYFDVHPPLGKMLCALAGLIHGQLKGHHDYNKDREFGDIFDYAGMRRFHAFTSSFSSVFAFLLMREFNFSIRRAMLLSMLFIFENGNISISRLVLLDSHLVSFTAATLYFTTLLYTRRNKKSSSEWKILLGLGVSLGCVMSVKWVGCFTASQVFLYIFFDIYSKMKSKKLSTFSLFILRRIIFLVAVPVCLYMAFFYMHFRICNVSGPEDGSMSSHFQVSLRKDFYKDLKKYIPYDYRISIKGRRGFLHSHFHAYPDYKIDLPADASKDDILKYLKQDPVAQFQVTAYGHRDENNYFFIKKARSDNVSKFVRDGDIIAFEHAQTLSYITATNEPAYVEKGCKVVAAKLEVRPDPAAEWIVEINKDEIKKEDRVKAITTSFYLKSVKTGQYLCVSDKNYPAWGFEQTEIRTVEKKNKNCLFNIDENFTDMVPENEPYTDIEPSFFKKLIEYNVLMYNVNNSFVSDPDLEPEGIVSKSYEWPILRRGLRMSQWNQKYKFFMFMNPLILYSTTLSVLICPFYLLGKFIKTQRKKLAVKEKAAVELEEHFEKENEGNNLSVRKNLGGTSQRKKNIASIVIESKIQSTDYDEQMKQIDFENKINYNKNLQDDVFFLYVAIGGWAFHYFPFCVLGRVLYLHHYFPALYFATFCLCYLLKKRSFLKSLSYVAFCIFVYACFSPLTYGFLDQSKVKCLRLVKTWNFVD